MEHSAIPEKALPIANTLRVCSLNQGHLRSHMPNHIDTWVGQYMEAIEINTKAVHADKAYVKEAEVSGGSRLSIQGGPMTLRSLLL